jgi:hypothetical protein
VNSREKAEEVSLRPRSPQDRSPPASPSAAQHALTRSCLFLGIIVYVASGSTRGRWACLGACLVHDDRTAGVVAANHGLVDADHLTMVAAFPTLVARSTTRW